MFPVMPMEIFVSCVGDLATLGGPVLVVTPVCSPPGSFSFLSARPWGIRKFLPWQFPSVLAEWSFWNVVTGARRTRGTLAIWTHTRRERKCIAGFSDYGLLITVYSLLFVLI